jgi:hypothetical protein
VTFTQDTWEHIYKVKDEEYSESRIVGWYHSHPGFGIFLSEHDAFIHRNFFSAREQIAWVYDPHNDEEGFFGWTNERITRVGHVTFSDPRGGEDSAKDESPIRSKAVAEDDVEGSPSVAVGPYTGSSRWLQWVVSVLSYVLAIAVGFLIAWFLFPRIIAIGVPVDPRTGVPLVNVPDRVLMQKAQPPAITNSLQPKTEPSDSSKKPQAASEAKSAQ